MKRTSTLKRGNGFKKKTITLKPGEKWESGFIPFKSNGFKKVVGNSLCNKHHTLKRSSFNRTPTDIQKDVGETDSKFSKHIINRDKKCLNCGSTQMLTCSHFHGRANYATRFEPLNCVTFCIRCHDIMESKKSGAYMDWMIEWLGNDQFMILDHISKMDISKVDSLKIAHNLLKKVETNSDIQY